jgi:hypothetical protein
MQLAILGDGLPDHLQMGDPSGVNRRHVYVKAKPKVLAGGAMGAGREARV